MRKSTDQNNSEYGHFLRSVIFCLNTKTKEEKIEDNNNTCVRREKVNLNSTYYYDCDGLKELLFTWIPVDGDIFLLKGHKLIELETVNGITIDWNQKQSNDKK